MSTYIASNGRELPRLGGRDVEDCEPCPECQAGGHLTTGGRVITLKRIVGDDGRLFCLNHGYDYRTNR